MIIDNCRNAEAGHYEYQSQLDHYQNEIAELNRMKQEEESERRALALQRQEEERERKAQLKQKQEEKRYYSHKPMYSKTDCLSFG